MLFLSIHPEHVEAIIEGRKTVELRKRKPNIDPGSTVVIYATMPKCEAVAVATIRAIQSGSPSELWKACGKQAAVSAQAFSDYYVDAKKAVGIHLSNVAVFEHAVSLRELRKQWHGFHPPQQYRYLDLNQQRFITTRPTFHCA